jgi:hypothetical protein
MQNYVSLNVDYMNFNRGGSGIGVRGDGGLGGGLSLGLVGGEKGEKNRKSGEINNDTHNQTNGEVVYKTIIIPFNIPIIDYVIENNLFVEIIDNINKNELIGQGKIRKYRFNGLPTDYDIYVEMENEDVYHVKKRGIMMRVKISEDQYKIIVKMLTNINIEKTGGSGGSSGSGGAASSSSGVMNKKKKGFFSLFACFKGV